MTLHGSDGGYQRPEATKIVSLQMTRLPSGQSSDGGDARGRDVVSLLTIYVVVLFGVPSGQVVGPLGGAGSPAQLMGLALAMWWAIYRLSQVRTIPAGPQPGRRVALILGAAVLASYVAATTRPIADIELRAADRGVLGLCAWLGILLATMDGVPTRSRLEVLLRRLVAAGGALATLGIVQFVTHQAIVNRLHVPGLTTNGTLVGVLSRNGLTRPAGTALHPIEFGVVLTVILPLAIHLAMHDIGRGPFRRWYPRTGRTVCRVLGTSCHSMLKRWIARAAHCFLATAAFCFS